VYNALHEQQQEEREIVQERIAHERQPLRCRRDMVGSGGRLTLTQIEVAEASLVMNTPEMFP
jgi:hypothetical protein